MRLTSVLLVMKLGKYLVFGFLENCFDFSRERNSNFDEVVVVLPSACGNNLVVAL